MNEDIEQFKSGRFSRKSEDAARIEPSTFQPFSLHNYSFILALICLFDGSKMAAFSECVIG